ncbi:hypothetical protein ACWEF6_10575 [Amycolatopsis sp. NPDC004772]
MEETLLLESRKAAADELGQLIRKGVPPRTLGDCVALKALVSGELGVGACSESGAGEMLETILADVARHLAAQTLAHLGRGSVDEATHPIFLAVAACELLGLTEPDAFNEMRLRRDEIYEEIKKQKLDDEAANAIAGHPKLLIRRRRAAYWLGDISEKTSQRNQGVWFAALVDAVVAHLRDEEVRRELLEAIESDSTSAIAHEEGGDNWAEDEVDEGSSTSTARVEEGSEHEFSRSWGLVNWAPPLPECPLVGDLAGTGSVDDTLLSGASASEVVESSPADDPTDVEQRRKGGSRRVTRALAFGLVTGVSVLVAYLTVVFSPLVFSFQTWSPVRNPWTIALTVTSVLVSAGLLAFYWRPVWRILWFFVACLLVFFFLTKTGYGRLIDESRKATPRLSSASLDDWRQGAEGVLDVNFGDGPCTDYGAMDPLASSFAEPSRCEVHAGSLYMASSSDRTSVVHYPLPVVADKHQEYRPKVYYAETRFHAEAGSSMGACGIEFGSLKERGIFGITPV